MHIIFSSFWTLYTTSGIEANIAVWRIGHIFFNMSNIIKKEEKRKINEVLQLKEKRKREKTDILKDSVDWWLNSTFTCVLEYNNAELKLSLKLLTTESSYNTEHFHLWPMLDQLCQEKSRTLRVSQASGWRLWQQTMARANCPFVYWELLPWHCPVRF